jgi:MoaA/NifB/PqqE/SkfB family radical SAM enzyme
MNHARALDPPQSSRTFAAAAKPVVAATTSRAKGVNEGKGFVFISHIGDVYPSGFLPLKADNVKQQSLEGRGGHKTTVF